MCTYSSNYYPDKTASVPFIRSATVVLPQTSLINSTGTFSRDRVLTQASTTSTLRLHGSYNVFYISFHLKYKEEVLEATKRHNYLISHYSTEVRIILLSTIRRRVIIKAPATFVLNPMAAVWLVLQKSTVLLVILILFFC